MCLTTDPSGGYVVTCRDVPEAITQGETITAALAEASDALDEALHAYMTDTRVIPKPSRRRADEHPVSVPVATALKLTVWLTMREQKISNVELARRLGVDEKEVRRTLDPHHGTKVPRLEAALHALGGRVELRVG